MAPWKSFGKHGPLHNLHTFGCFDHVPYGGSPVGTWLSAACSTSPTPSRPGLRIVAPQAEARPFALPTGLVGVPMSPISDVNAFRTGRWPPEAFQESIRRCVSRAIENGAAFDFLGHPSCLLVEER